MAFDTETTLEPLCRAADAGVDFAALEALRADTAADIVTPIPAGFRLQSGERLGQPNVVARLHGRAGAPLVVVAGGISSGRFVHRTETNGLGWWSDAVSVGGPIDLRRCQVLAFDYAPEAIEGQPAVTITTRDQARLLTLVLDQLGVETVSAFVGCSYGGMIGLAFAELHPERLKKLVVVSAAHRTHPLATAWRGIQRRILKLATEAGRPEDGVALARELAMTTYRTPDEFEARFSPRAPEQAGDPYAVCDYLISRGQGYDAVTSASRWISLSDSLDRHSVDPEQVACPLTVVGFTSDRLAPIEDSRELAALAPNAQLVEAWSIFGHDAFLKEREVVGRAVADALAPLFRSSPNRPYAATTAQEIAA